MFHHAIKFQTCRRIGKNFLKGILSDKKNLQANLDHKHTSSILRLNILKHFSTRRKLIHQESCTTTLVDWLQTFHAKMKTISDHESGHLKATSMLISVWVIANPERRNVTLHNQGHTCFFSYFSCPSRGVRRWRRSIITRGSQKCVSRKSNYFNLKRADQYFCLFEAVLFKRT